MSDDLTFHGDDRTAATLAQAAALRDAVQALSDQIATVATQGNRSHGRIRLMMPFLAIDILLSLGLGFVGWAAMRATDRAQTVKQAAVETCVAGNQARAANLAAWTYVLSNPAVPAAQQRINGQLLVNLQAVYAPRVCTAQ